MSSLPSTPRNERIRPRPVSFGNPALGTYGGCVYTLEENGLWTQDGFHRPTDSPTTNHEKMVAMVNVPPEQVPEGILNFCRSHRRYIELVRIVISSRGQADNSSSTSNAESPPLTTTLPQSGRNPPPLSLDRPDLASTENSSSSLTKKIAALDLEEHDISAISHNKSPSASAMECAASILAADEEEAKAKKLLNLEEAVVDDDEESHNDDEKAQSSRTYIVLLELSTEEAATAFVRDLHGKPFSSLEPDVTCSVHHVVALKGQDGVSLMSPFFAPTTISSSSPANNKETQHNSNNKGSQQHHDGRARTPTAGLQTAHEENNNAKASPLAAAAHSSGVRKVTSLPSLASASTKEVHNPLSSPLGATSSHAGEVHNCAVCLERLDLDVAGKKSSILTTVCNHSFHLECLLQWQDSPCPVCRYDHSGLNEALSQCHVCGTTEQNYVCLICGVVSCGGRSMGGHGDSSVAACAPREDETEDNHQQQQHEESSSSLPTHNMSHGHARQHYNETLHAYALDTETQHVWDFVGQGYVHRLLQNAKDDKLVEANDPNNTSSYERSLSPGLSDAQEDEVVHRKLEGFASEYYTMLKSQLEQQRIYYEGRLEEIRREYGDRGSHGRRPKKKKVTSASAELISALKQERNQLAQRCMTLKRRYEKVSEDVAFLKNTTESLEANKAPLKHQVREAQRERAETRDMVRKCLPPLEAKVAKLMMQLEESVVEQEEEASPCNRRQGRKFFGGGSSDKKPAAKK